MKKVILVRYGEIILKGLNRPIFEEKLMSNIRKTLLGMGKLDVKRSQARIYVEPKEDNFDFEGAIVKLVKVFGIVSVSIVSEIPSNFEDIKKQSLEMVRKQVEKLAMLSYRENHSSRKDRSSNKDCSSRKESLNFEPSTTSFKVDAKRGDKRFPMNSPEICMELGGYLLENIPALRVDVHNPDFILYVEVRESAYIYCDIIHSQGGLPIGTNGKGMLLLSGGIDSPVAGWMMAKRGMEIEAVHFYSYPYTSERAKEKVISLAKILSRYCYHIKLHIVPFTEIQMEINGKCPEDELTIIMRRAMMTIAEKIAVRNGAQALLTGESLGQVASQTVQGLAVTNAIVSMPVFRPLIGMDKNEVVEIARKIDTFETSILPYEDCCTVFVAKHPNTKPKLKKIEELEAVLQINDMIEEAINNTETIIVTE